MLIVAALERRDLRRNLGALVIGQVTAVQVRADHEGERSRPSKSLNVGSTPAMTQAWYLFLPSEDHAFVHDDRLAQAVRGDVVGELAKVFLDRTAGRCSRADEGELGDGRPASAGAMPSLGARTAKPGFSPWIEVCAGDRSPCP